ncbi:hypothetical protein ElyMa_006718800 [Elysia marginata]|uniref:Uncharacterized protein n=1 Tax=Elysia marginata TaxID=1093978 RepID=A0AAV4IT78_9GAST|nr:hypothetical protein ElyMa_006718800 [Elysia marginata]
MKKFRKSSIYQSDSVASQSCRSFREAANEAAAVDYCHAQIARDKGMSPLTLSKLQRTKKWTSCISFGNVKKGLLSSTGLTASGLFATTSPSSPLDHTITYMAGNLVLVTIRSLSF